MSQRVEIVVHEIATDGLPPVTDGLIGRVAFIHDGAVLSGWPLDEDDNGDISWESSANLCAGEFYGVTHWIELPVPVWELARTASTGADTNG